MENRKQNLPDEEEHDGKPAEHRCIEEQLRLSEKKFRTLVTHALDGIYIMQEESYTYVNAPFCKITGYSEEEILSAEFDFNRLLSGEAKKYVRERYEKRKRGRDLPATYETKIVAKDGKIKDIELSTVQLEKTPLTVIGFMREITRRKQAEEELRKSEERYKSIISVSNTGGWEYHRDTDYLWCSPEYFSMLGQDPADFPTDQRGNLGDVWVNLIHPADRDKATGIFRKYLGAGSPGIYENWFRMKHREGHWVWIWSRGQTLRDPEGSPTAMTVGTHIDITENKKNEEFISGQIEEKNILLSEIHHRVKNNMAVISSLLELQVDFFDQNEEPGKLLLDAQNRIKSMAMIHELVYKSKDFAAINAEKLIQRLVDYQVDIYRSKDKNITVHVCCDDIMLDMNDSVPFTLVAHELIANAYKHAFTKSKSGRIDVFLIREIDGCRFVVQDDGRGMADLDQLHNPDSFGYTIIHVLVKQLQGKLEISSPEKGLRVEVWIPDKKVGHERA